MIRKYININFMHKYICFLENVIIARWNTDFVRDNRLVIFTVFSGGGGEYKGTVSPESWIAWKLFGWIGLGMDINHDDIFLNF